MTERYKVLVAMLALGEFTVADLARFSGVKKTTVRTAIDRGGDLLEEVDRQSTGRPGGQFKRYRVKADQVERLRSEIDRLFQEFSNIPYVGSKGRFRPSPEIRLNLAAAEDALMHLYPKAKGMEEKHRLLNLANISFESARTDVEELLAKAADSSEIEVIKVRLRSIELLKNLCKTELAIESGLTLKHPVDFAMVVGQLIDIPRELLRLIDIARELLDLGQSNQAASLLKRTSNSSVLRDFVDFGIRPEDFNRSRFADELVETVKQQASKGQHRDVLRLASALDRPFWLTGRFRARITIGDYLEHAASALDEHCAQMQALIDMKGWTNAVIGDVNEALKNLNVGIEIARNKNNAYWLAKGYRHIGGLHYLRTGDLEASGNYLREAERAAAAISDERAKREILGGILYGRAEICWRRAGFVQALKYNRLSRKLYRRDNQRERSIKVDLQLGQIFLGQGQTQKAREILLKVADIAREFERPYELALALELLGRVNLEEKQIADARLCLQEAKINFASIGLNSSMIDSLLESIRVTGPSDGGNQPLELEAP